MGLGGKVTRAQGVRLLSEGPPWEALSLGLPISCQFPSAELGALTLTLEMNWASWAAEELDRAHPECPAESQGGQAQVRQAALPTLVGLHGGTPFIDFCHRKPLPLPHGDTASCALASLYDTPRGCWTFGVAPNLISMWPLKSGPSSPLPEGGTPMVTTGLGRVLAHWCVVTETPKLAKKFPFGADSQSHTVLSRGPITLVLHWPEAWLCPDPQSHADFLGGCEMASCLPLPAGCCSDAVVKQEACGAHVGM